MVVVAGMPVASVMRRQTDSGPATTLAAVQLKAIRSTLASASSWACSSMARVRCWWFSRRVPLNVMRVVTNWTPGGAMRCGSKSHRPPEGYSWPIRALQPNI